MNQEDLTKWEINGTTLVLDIDDIGDLERYERAFKQMGEAAKQIPKDGTASEITRAYCTTFYSMYDCIFGSGTAEKIHQKTAPGNARRFTHPFWRLCLPSGKPGMPPGRRSPGICPGTAPSGGGRNDQFTV